MHQSVIAKINCEISIVEHVIKIFEYKMLV